MIPRRLRAEVGDARYWRTDEGLVVTARIRNDEDRTLLVSSAIRQIQFDASSGELTVWFSDRGRDPTLVGAGCRLNTVPRTVPVEAGAEVEIQGRIPAQIRRLVGIHDGAVDFEVHRVEDVQQVTVHVAVADAPFYFNPKGGTAVRQLTEWGDDLEASARRTPRRPGDKESGA